MFKDKEILQVLNDINIKLNNLLTIIKSNRIKNNHKEINKDDK